MMDIWDVTKFLWGVMIPHSWYLHRKLDKLQDEHVKRDEFNGTVQSLRNRIDESDKQMSYRIDQSRTEINQRLDRLLEVLMDKR